MDHTCVFDTDLRMCAVMMMNHIVTHLKLFYQVAQRLLGNIKWTISLNPSNAFVPRGTAESFD